MELRKIFWKHTILQIAVVIKNHLRQARLNLEAIPEGKYKNRLLYLLTPLQNSVVKSERQRKQTIQFLKQLTPSKNP